MLRKRLFALICAVAFLFLVILARTFYVQVIWGDTLQARALDQWTRDLPIVAARGQIVDRNGVVLAGNASTYSVFLRSRSVKDAERTATVLAETLGLDREDLLKKIADKNVSERTLKRQVDKATVDKLGKSELPGVYFARDNSRVYPYGDLLSQVLGYTTSDSVGQAGIEAYYDKYLKGMNGQILYEADLLGIELEGSTPEYVPATDGLNIRLTVDYEIQEIAESVMAQAYKKHSPKAVRAVVLDPATSEVLAMVNRPSFDLNEVPRDDKETLDVCGRNGLVVDIYEPGSTFKVLTAAANLEEYLNGNAAAFSPEHIFSSARTRTVDGQVIKCWSNHAGGKHANENLAAALNNSCNPVFVDIALALGKETMYDYIEKFGYGSVTGIDFVGEAQGMVLPETTVKDCDLARIGFGQTIAVTPLQLANATAAAVNGGLYHEPYLVKEIYDKNGLAAEIVNPETVRRAIGERASALLREMLEGVVRDGSGKHAYIEGYRVGGKTGTAQKYENGRIADGKYVSSFVGFFPADNPEYLALIVIDEPVGEHYGSTVAAPYAKMIFEGIIRAKNIAPFE